MLCSGRVASAHGWRLAQNRADDVGKKGSRNGRYDPTVFTFRHDNGTVEESTKYDLAIKY